MLGMLRRLFGGSRHERAVQADPAARRRSATADVLAQRRRPVGATNGSQASSGAKEDSFDPYNTGKFDRAASWERVRQSHR